MEHLSSRVKRGKPEVCSVELPESGAHLTLSISRDGDFSAFIDGWPVAKGKAVKLPDGKTIFMTREEAEAALRKEGEE